MSSFPIIGIVASAKDVADVSAYQWHPERLQAIDADNLTIFAEFVGACHHS